MTGKIVTILCAAALLTSCGEYNKALKSTDYNYKVSDYLPRFP